MEHRFGGKENGMKTKEPIKRSVTFQCLACKDLAAMERPAFLEHIKAVHGYERAQSRRQLIQALDGSDWYSNAFEWTIPTPSGDIKAIQSDTGPRGKHDPMRCED